MYDKAIFKKLAKDAIRVYLTSGEFLEINEDNLITYKGGDMLLDKLACFISLNVRGELRGCIGTIYAEEKLYKNIIKYAIYAATKDNRFPNIKLEEVNELDIEISILTPLEELQNIEDFILGKNGLMIEKGRKSGLLLPQVAAEWDFSKQEFLEQLCFKAGLDKFAYKDGKSKIFKFSAIIL